MLNKNPLLKSKIEQQKFIENGPIKRYGLNNIIVDVKKLQASQDNDANMNKMNDFILK